MKAILLFKIYTLVGFLLVSSLVQRAFSASCENPLNVSRTTNCSSKFKTDPAKEEQCASIVECLISSKEEEDKDRQDRKEKEGECKSSLAKYDEAAKQVAEDCSRLGEENYAKCVQKSKDCSKDLNSFNSESSGNGESSFSGSLVKIIGIYGQMNNINTNNNSQAAAGCVIENNDKEAEKEQALDEKVTRLREEISKLQEDQAKEDHDLNVKNQEVQKEIADLQKEFDKAVTQRQTKNQQDAGQMQKVMLAAEKKKRENLMAISDINTKIANLSFEHQKINLMMADQVVIKQCRDTANKFRDDTIKTKPSFTVAESSKLKKDMEQLENTCLQAQALEKQKQTKNLIDQKQQLQSKIELLKSSNEDESKAIAQEQKQIEALNSIATEEEKKDLDSKNQKQNLLNKSVVDMETFVANKKKSMDAKIKAKEDQINKILLDRQNVKAKFSKVYSAVSSNSSNARSFVNLCCGANPVKGYADACTRLKEDYAIKEPKSKVRSGGGSTK